MAKMFHDYHEFIEHVGVIHDAEFMMHAYGIVPADDDCMFLPGQLDELVQFCWNQIEFHIVTDTHDFENIPGCVCTMMNHVSTARNVKGYYLANGEVDECYLENIDPDELAHAQMHQQIPF